MTIRPARAGFILPVTLVMIGIASITVTSVIGYVSFAARQTRIYLAKDRCRFAAISAIENAKCNIYDGLQDYISANFSSIQIAPGKSKAYNWFDTVSSDRRSIGSPNPVKIFADKTYPLEENDCRVWAGIGTVVHESNAPMAIVPIIATAEYTYPDGLTVTATIQERLYFGTGQSKVFDNAYFVNNYGWMNGGFTINGEFRANGNVSLAGGCVVNGLVYAAPNEEIGAKGTVSINNASIKDRSTYRSQVGTRARYDRNNLDELGSYDPVTKSGSISSPRYNADGVQISGSQTENGQAVVHQGEDVDPVEMPFVADLEPYVDYAKEENGTLSYPSASYRDYGGNTCTTPAGTVYAHHSVNDAGPSGDVENADAGSLLLIGTKTDPIRINGPVVVDGDVIIKGYVTGQGTIYAGRNVHIIGDIRYVNAPTWTHSKTDEAAETEQEANESKDMLGLVAKGNIVMGNATSSSIAANVNSGDDIAYTCDENDAKIGYNKNFSGDYTSTERVTGLSATLASTAPGGYDTSTGKFGKIIDGTKQVTTTETVTETSDTGHYETQTVTEQVKKEISYKEYKQHEGESGYSSEKSQSSGGWGGWGGGGGWGGDNTKYYYTYTDTTEKQVWVSDGTETTTKEVTTTKNVKCGVTDYSRRYYQTCCDDRIISTFYSSISQIDAVMYNNHGVFGSLGANFQINGALVCRDEGLTANGGSFNWDMRLRRKKDSEIVEKMGLPKGSGDPYVVDWMEVPDSLNPVYSGSQGTN